MQSSHQHCQVFKTASSLLYAFFWVIPRRLNFICRRFGTLCSVFIGGQVSAYEEWNRVFRNVGIQTSDAGKLPGRKYTTFRTRRKFEIKQAIFLLSTVSNLLINLVFIQVVEKFFTFYGSRIFFIGSQISCIKTMLIHFFMFEFPCIITLYYIKNQHDATLAVLFISHCTITLHVSDAFCAHHQEY